MLTRLQLVSLCAIVAFGCSPNVLYFATHTKLGISANAVDARPSSVSLGYDRFEGAVIPVEQGDKNELDNEAASVFACLNLDNRWFGGLKLDQVFATGAAAQSAATKTGKDCVQ